MFEIIAAAKARPRAAHDDDMDVLVGLGHLDRGANLARHAMRDRVEMFGTVERDRRDPVVGRVRQRFKAHRQFSCGAWRSEEHTSELQSLMRISYAVFCLKKKNITKIDKKNIKK